MVEECGNPVRKNICLLPFKTEVKFGKNNIEMSFTQFSATRFKQ